MPVHRITNADINQVNRQFWDTRIAREHQGRIDRIKAHCLASGVKYDPAKGEAVWRQHPLNTSVVRPD